MQKSGDEKCRQEKEVEAKSCRQNRRNHRPIVCQLGGRTVRESRERKTHVEGLGSSRDQGENH